jgi:Ca2+-binding RTX toxin-like protein
VEYGPTTAYGSASGLDTNPITAHAVTVTGLAAGTLYHFRVSSRDAAGNLAVSADFTLTTAPAPDTTAPTAGAITPPDVTTAGSGEEVFMVTYADDTAVLASSIDGFDVVVTGPNGFTQLAKFLAVDASSDGTRRSATYCVTAPGGTWDGAASGTYAVALRPGQVCDTAGNFAPAATLAWFNVTIPQPAPQPDPQPVPDPIPLPPQVATAELVIDPWEAGGNALVVHGTSGDDSILFSISKNKVNVVVTVNGTILGQYPKAGFARVIAYGLDGNDRVEVRSTVPQRSFLDGGAGNDTLVGGAKQDVLLGGTGDDTLLGNLGTDVLIGNEGADRADGGDGSDLLVGGSTAYDSDGGALSRVAAEWRSGRTYARRVADLRTGAGVPALTAASVFADPDADGLRGGRGVDWFFSNTPDAIQDRASGEQLG